MYTHYWKGSINNKQFAKAVEEIKFLYENRPKRSFNAGCTLQNRIALENDEEC